MLLSERHRNLETRRRRKQRGEPEDDTDLAGFAAHHLEKTKEADGITDQWIEANQKHLERAIEFFCNPGAPPPTDGAGNAILTGIDDRTLDDITDQEVDGFRSWLARLPNGRAGTLASSSQRKHLNSRSKPYRRAISDGRVPVGDDPVAMLMDKPKKEGRADGLLFPSHRSENGVTDFRKALDLVAEQAGWEVGTIRPYAFRHTYAAVRFQTFDHRHPVSSLYRGEGARPWRHCSR